jgi:hypothetical protein
MAFASVRTLASAACVLVTLITASTAFAQESKSEESSRETKEEIKSILSDIESRQPPPVDPPVIPPSQVRPVSEGKRIAWQPFLCLGVALVLVGLGLVFFRVWAAKARERRIEDMAEAIRRSRL